MNFIIYNNMNSIDIYIKEAINKVMMKYDTYYNIRFYDNKFYDPISESLNKLYIINMDSKIINAKKIIHNIRSKGDIESPIILIGNKNINSQKLDKLFTFKCPINNLNDCKDFCKLIEFCYQINNLHQHLVVYKDGCRINIPYKNILYIEKFLHGNNSYVYTITKERFIIRKSISTLEKELSSTFVKSHQSCLINLQNVTHIDFRNHIIYFGDYSINLLSKYKIKHLKEIIDFDNYNY